MRTVKMDLWNIHKAGIPIVVTTNLTIKSNGEGVLGRGIAAQAALRFPSLPKAVGRANANRTPVVYHPEYNLYTFAVKYNWWEDADLNLIRMSYRYLFNGLRHVQHTVAISRPGCGNGRLDWKDEVEPIFAATLYEYRDVDDLIIFVP